MKTYPSPDILCSKCGADQQPCRCARLLILRSGDVPSVKPE